MSNESVAQTPPSPVPLLDTFNAFHQSAAMKAAIELDVFTAIADGVATTAGLAAKCGAAERGVRILCDFLVIHGFLTKQATNYSLTSVAAAYLNKRSPAYLGSAIFFLHSPTLMAGFNELSAAVRKGGTAISDEGTLSSENDVWVSFARAMAPMMAMPADVMAQKILAGRKSPMQVLDIAAGHGLYGLAFARHNSMARVTGLDWANVLEVAKENAAKMGVADQYETIAGSAFDVDLRGPYDLILLPNFLHHFDPATNETLLKRLRPALKSGGQVVTLEFVPNDDRVSPAGAAMFAMVMLATTPAGDAYTFAEYDKMFRNAGFGASRPIPLEGTPNTIIVTQRE